MPLAGGLVAISASLLVAAAQGPAGDRDDGRGRHQHLTTVVTPLRGHAVRAHGDPEQASSAVLRLRNDVDAPSVESSSPAGVTALPSSGGPDETTTTTTTPTTGATAPVQHRRAAAGSGPSRRRAGGAPATAAGSPPSKPSPAWPGTLLIPPASLPTPAVIVPASSGLGAAPLAATAVAVLLIGGLLGIRLARRPG